MKITYSLYLCSVLLFLSIVSPINATQITEAVYATVTSTKGVTQVTIGDALHLFDVTYDDQSSIMHNYYVSDGSIYSTMDKNTNSSVRDYVFLSDAVFTFSDTIAELINEYGEFSATNIPTYPSWNYEARFYNNVYRTHPYLYQSTNYQTTHTGYSFHVRIPTPFAVEEDSGSGRLNLHDDDQHLYDPDFEAPYVSFGDPYAIPSSPQTSPVPEPSTILLFGLGLFGLAGVSRKKITRRT
jgi:hypothetical protein